MKTNFIVSILLFVSSILSLFDSPNPIYFWGDAIPNLIYFWGDAMIAVFWLVIALLQSELFEIPPSVKLSPIVSVVFSLTFFIDFLVPYTNNFYHWVDLIVGSLALNSAAFETFIPMKVSGS